MRLSLRLFAVLVPPPGAEHPPLVLGPYRAVQVQPDGVFAMLDNLPDPQPVASVDDAGRYVGTDGRVYDCATLVCPKKGTRPEQLAGFPSQAPAPTPATT